jgi:hypothetical protein
MAKQGHHQWTVVDDVFITFTMGTFDASLWDPFVEDLKRKQFSKMLCTSLGKVEVTSLQRKAAAEAVKVKGTELAVVTDEAIVRGLVTAASWVGVKVKAFSWADLDKALRHLQVPDSSAGRVIRAVESFKGQALGVVKG